MKNLNIESEGGPGRYLWTRSLIEGTGHPQEKWMKAGLGTGSGLGQNLQMISIMCLRNWMKTEIEGQGIVIKGAPDQDLWKIGILMSEMTIANMKSPNIMI